VVYNGQEEIEGTGIAEQVVSVNVLYVTARGLFHEAGYETYRSVYEAIKDMLVEDFKNGDVHLTKMEYVKGNVPAGMLGYAEVAREIYSMLREGRVYGRVEVVDDLGRKVTYHLIIPSQEKGVFYMVQVGDKYYMVDLRALCEIKPRRVEDFELAERRSMEMYRGWLEEMEKEVLELIDRGEPSIPLDVKVLLLKRAFARALLEGMQQS